MNQERLGSIEASGALPEKTLTRATIANSARVTISAPSRPTWVRAESSIPITTIEVISAIQTTPSAVTATVDSARLFSPKSSKL